jgi:colanic acid/amylovoran biosynthesis protein
VSGKIVIFNVFGHLNSGDAMLVETLHEMLSNACPEDQIEGIAFDVAAQEKWMPQIKWHERIGSRAYPAGFDRLFQAFYLMIGCAIAVSRQFLPLRRLLPKRQRDAIDAFLQAKIAISCPGGYLQDSNFAYLLNLLQMLIARRLCPQVVLAPQSVGPVRSGLARRALAFTLKRMNAVYVREAPSREFLREIAPELRNVRMAGDLAFWYRRKSDHDLTSEWQKLGIDPQRPVIGMTVVDWSFPESSAPDAAREAYIRSLVKAARYARDDLGYQVVIFNQVSFDLPVAERVAEGFPGVVVDRFERDSAMLATLIAGCDMFIGSRFHSCIFALIGNVPTLAISYLPKTTGIMASLELSDFVLPIEAISPELLRCKLDALNANRDHMTADLPQRIGRYRADNDRFIRDIAELVG